MYVCVCVCICMLLQLANNHISTLHAMPYTIGMLYTSWFDFNMQRFDETQKVIFILSVVIVNGDSITLS